jgi:hypothetical protein
VFDYFWQIHRFESIPLRTAYNRFGELVHLGCGKNKYYVLRRFLERLKERVKRFFGKHMYLIDDIHFVFRTAWSGVHFVAKVADFIDAAITGGVDFNNI